MRIENSRSWLLIETRRSAATVIWPWSPAASTFKCSSDSRFGWTDEGNGEKWFYLGRTIVTLERKAKRPALGVMLADCGEASGELEAA